MNDKGKKMVDGYPENMADGVELVYRPERSVEEEVERLGDEQVVADVSESTLELFADERHRSADTGTDAARDAADHARPTATTAEVVCTQPGEFIARSTK